MTVDFDAIPVSDRTGQWITLSDERIGWSATVTDYGDGDIIGLDGPFFWRPTRQWALRRAMRYVRRRTAKVEAFPADAIETVWLSK